MKYYFILLCWALFLAGHLHAQKPQIENAGTQTKQATATKIPASEPTTLSKKDSTQKNDAYHIVYDMDTRKYTTLPEKKVRKGQQIYVEIINLNTFLYRASITAEAKELTIDDSSFDIGAILPGGSSQFTGLYTATLDTLNDSTGDKNPFKSGGSRGGNLSVSTPLDARIDSIADILRITQNSLQSAYVALDDISEKTDKITLAQTGVRRLQLSENPKYILRDIERITQELFGVADPEKTEAKQLAPYRNLDIKARRRLEEIRGYRDIFLRQISRLNEIAAGQTGTTKVDTLLTAANRTAALVGADLEVLEKGKLPSFADLVAVQHALLDLKRAKYRLGSSFFADKDEMILQINLTADSLPASRRTVTPPNVKIPVRGGLKINASIGLNFAAFNKDPKSYFIQDTTIAATEGDKFIPYITTMLHAYPRAAGDITLGGSFGIGFPLSNNNQTTSAPAFFLGPSLIVGKQQRIVVSVGVKGARVNRLGRGLEVGQSFEAGDGDIPLQAVYEFGYYLGLSFNL